MSSLSCWSLTTSCFGYRIIGIIIQTKGNENRKKNCLVMSVKCQNMVSKELKFMKNVCLSVKHGYKDRIKEEING